MSVQQEGSTHVSVECEEIDIKFFIFRKKLPGPHPPMAYQKIFASMIYRTLWVRYFCSCFVKRQLGWSIIPQQPMSSKNWGVWGRLLGSQSFSFCWTPFRISQFLWGVRVWAGGSLKTNVFKLELKAVYKLSKFSLGSIFDSPLYLGLSPHPVTVATRIITFLVGDPYKPSFPTVTGRGVDPTYTLSPFELIVGFWIYFTVGKPATSVMLLTF